MNAVKKASAPTRKAAVQKPVQIELDQPVSKPPVRWGYVITMVVGIVVLAVASALALGHTMRGWEHDLFVHINGVSLPHWVASQIAKPLSNAVWGIVALVAVFLLIPKYRLLAWQYAVAGGSAFVLATIIEKIIDRARPAMLTSDLVARAAQSGAGFPSTHVSILTALCVTLWAFVAWPWRIVLAVLVLAEAWSRVYLGVHAPLDVIGGIGVGLTVGAAIRILPAKIRKIFWIT